MDIIEFLDAIMGLSDEAIGQIEDFLTRSEKQSDFPGTDSHISDIVP